MDIKQCKKCGEIQRSLNKECVACDCRRFYYRGIKIDGFSLKELWERFAERYDEYEMLIGKYDIDKLGDFLEFILVYDCEFIYSVADDLREYLRLYNDTNVDFYGKTCSIADDLLSIKLTENLLMFTKGALWRLSHD